MCMYAGITGQAIVLCSALHVRNRGYRLGYIYMCVKALPRVCTGNTARGGVSRGKYSTRRSRVLYLPRDTPECCIFRT